MILAWCIAFLFLLCLLRFVNITSRPSAPTLYYSGSEFLAALVTACPILTKVYRPPLIWGRSGHLQTIAFSCFGRFRPWQASPRGKRVSTIMQDGATSTFDVFQPASFKASSRGITIAVSPPLDNSSESFSMITFVHLMQENGYRVAVLNPLGVLPNVHLTSPTVLTFGGTKEFGEMVEWCCKEYTDTKMFVVGFSLGANIAMKYLGEKEQENSNSRILAGVSVCQGYDGNLASKYLMQWRGFRRLYTWMIAKSLKRLLKKHSKTLFNEHAMTQYKERVDLEKTFSSNSLMEFDDNFTRKIPPGFPSVEEYYELGSSRHYLADIKIPLFIINTADDPLLPEHLLDVPKKHVARHEGSLFVVTKHGGHLGFFQGEFMQAETTTWIDHAILQYCNAITAIMARQNLLK